MLSSSKGHEAKNFFGTECTTGRPHAIASIATVSKCSRPAAKLPKTRSLSQNSSLIEPWGTLLIKSMFSLSSFASCFVLSRSFPALKVLIFIFSGTSDAARSNLSVPFMLKSGADARKMWYSGLFSGNGFGKKISGSKGMGKYSAVSLYSFATLKTVGWATSILLQLLNYFLRFCPIFYFAVFRAGHSHARGRREVSCPRVRQYSSPKGDNGHGRGHPWSEEFCRLSRGFAPESSCSFDVLLFDVCWEKLEQSFSYIGTIVNHDDFHWQIQTMLDLFRYLFLLKVMILSYNYKYILCESNINFKFQTLNEYYEQNL